MKKNVYIFVAALSVLFSCSKGREDDMDPEGKYDPLIHFGVETYYGDNVTTKTVYSGELVGTPKYERINWNVGSDKIRVISSAGVTKDGDNSADYDVVANSRTNETGLASSEAEASPTVAGKELYWGTQSADHYFFAVYPSPEATTDPAFATIEEGKKATITGTVPQVQTPLEKKLLVAEDLSDPANPVYNTYEFTPDMTHAYMYASAQVAGKNVGVKKVPLKFKPLFNAYKFYLSAGDNVAKKFKLTKITLTSEDGGSGRDLAGDFTTTIQVADDGLTGGFVQPLTDANPRYRSVSMEVPSADQKEFGTDTYIFTLLALPIDQTRLTLEVDFQDCTDPLNPVARTRKMRLRNKTTNEWYTLPASRKLYVYAGVPDIEYVFEVTQELNTFDPNGETKGDYYHVVSYKKMYNRTTNAEEYEAVPWTVTEYNTGEGWKSIGTGTANPAWTVLDKYADDGKAPTGDPIDPGTAKVSYDAEMKEAYSLEDDDVWIDLGNDTPENAIDLSNYDFMTQQAYPGRTMQGTPADTPYETANCYVVSGPGWYKIPMVYGNAFQQGNVNEKAYHREYNTYLMDDFRGSLPTGHGTVVDIGYPWITKPSPDGQGLIDSSWPGGGARYPHLLWQDVPGMVYVPRFNPDGKADNPKGQKIQIIDSSTEERNIWCEDDYLYFKVDNLDNRAGGNAVIALCADDNVDSPVIWSWHIWALPKKMLTSQTVYYWLDPKYQAVGSVPANDNTPTRLASNEMLDVNVGYVAGKPDRYCRFRFVQDKTGETRTIHLVQRGDAQTASAVHYQWGRKDPMYSVSGDESAGFAKTIYLEDGSTVSSAILPVRTYAENGYSDEKRYDSVSDWTYYTVSMPHKMFSIPKSGGYTWSGFRYDNLWDGNVIECMDNANDHWDGYYVSKTVYDPCPPGFKVPNEYAFTGFNLKGMDANVITDEEKADPTLVINGLRSSFYIGEQYKAGEPFGSQGMYLYCDPRDKSNGIMFFPALGRRQGFGAEAGTIREMYEAGFYWTSAPFLDGNYPGTLYARTFTMRRSKDDGSTTEGYPQCIPVYTVAAAPSTQPYAGFLRAHGCQVRPVRDRYEDAVHIPYEIVYVNINVPGGSNVYVSVTL